MPDDIRTAQPRLVRIAEELRIQGLMALGIALCTLVSWLSGWLLGENVRPGATGVAGLVGLVLALAALGPFTRRRVRRATFHELAPPGAIWETPADAGQRRMRLAFVLILGPMLLLALDRLTLEGGLFAGFLAGAAVGWAALALGEAGVWTRRERRRARPLHLLIPPRALMPPTASTDVYERTLPEPDEVSPFDIPL